MIPLLTVATDARPGNAVALVRKNALVAPLEAATFHRTPDGTWVQTTWQALWEEVLCAARGLRRRGLRQGDRLAIVARPCREWIVAEFGALVAGASVVGIEPFAAPEQIAWIVRNAKARGLVVDGPGTLARIPSSVLDAAAFCLTFDEPPPGHAERVSAWGQMLSEGGPAKDFDPADPTSGNAMMVIYTSGTTGPPKGIEYSHEQIMTACWAMLDQFPEVRGARLVCWLPMGALFQRMMNLLAMATRSTTYIVEDPREIMARLPEIRPTVFTAVPRFYEKLHAGIHDELAKRTVMGKRAVAYALAVGARWGGAVRAGARPALSLRLQHTVVDRLVLRRLRRVMGGDVKWMVSGSAAMPVWLLEFFHGMGLLILEAYGVTENALPVAANRPCAYRFGSVGRPLPPNGVRLAGDGEVLVTGGALFSGYLGEELPAERFTADGYYATGDYGRIDGEGFLFLIGRKAEMIKTTAGRRIAPATVEGVYRRSRYIDQIVVVGNNRPYLTALVSLHERVVRSDIEAAGDSLSGGKPLADSSPVRELVAKDMAAQDAALARHERIRTFAVLPTPLTVEAGELTATLKLRRATIEARYAGLIEEMYRVGATGPVRAVEPIAALAH